MSGPDERDQPFAMVADPQIADLRRRIERLQASEGGHRIDLSEPVLAFRSGLSFGDPAIDAHFPHGLAWGSHQIAGGAADPVAARAFIALLLARWLAPRPTATALIVQETSALREGGDIYGPGLHALGVDPGRLVLVRAHDGAEVLRLLNEALRVRAPQIVVGDLCDDAALADLSVTRRFNLAAANARALAFLTTPDLSVTSAALTRWLVASAPSSGLPRRLGAPALALELVRNRHGRTGRWILEWSSHDRAFRSVDAGGVRRLGGLEQKALAAPLGPASVDRPDHAVEPAAVLPFGAYRQAG
jgi:protein ImuA